MTRPTPDRPGSQRIALLGPVAPYRGGIAQYTTRLHRALAGLCQTRTYSFSRQYPAWLYPGESDIEPGKEGTREAGVDYRLDALNPLTWISTAQQIARGGCDLAILNWWTLFWAPGFALIAYLLRKRNIPVVLLCHNLFDHDSNRLKRTLSIKLLGQADAYLVHTQEQADVLRNIFPRRTVLRHPHPIYDQFPPSTAPLPKRGRLELLFFGFIRPYKGLDTLIEALAKLGDREVHLTVIGEPWCDPDELRRQVAASAAPNVDLHLGYMDDASAANFFARADMVVLPYRAATGSGVAAVAYHYDCPILATRVGGLKDIVEDGRTGFLVEPDDPHELSARIRDLRREDLDRLRAHVRAFKTKLTWESLAQDLATLARPVARENA